jgi:thiol-disulfide isomerase/thioredoxin
MAPMHRRSPSPDPDAPTSALTRRRRFVTAGLAAVLAGGVAQAAPAREVGIGEALRDAPLYGLNGPARRLADFRGRPLLINVWASWCGPCVAEMASLERLAWADGRLAFAMIGVSTDDERDQALAVLRRSNATISHFIDHDLVLEDMLGAKHIPLTVLVDAQGRVREKVYGAREWDRPEALQSITRALATKRPVAIR